MLSFLRRQATPLTAVLFVLTVVTGLAVLPQQPAQAIRAMHAWFSILWMVPVILHMQKNWRGLKGYWRRMSNRGL